MGAVEAASALLQQIGRYVAPQSIRSDRGSQFVNKTIEHLLKLVGTEHQLTVAVFSCMNNQELKYQIRNLKGLID